MKKKTANPALIHRTSCKIRFSEVDSMNVAWHGSYVKYLEDGREAFGIRYGIGYLDSYRAGYKTPIVDLQIAYKKPVTFGETITVETRYIPTEAAKILFDYIIYNEQGEEIIIASTIQVFLDETNRLVLQNPDFYLAWQKKWGIR
ncbi:MAG: acyl-CoA thioesterase [Dysgonamonadaceae bacterium]|jgi:acyl-CoA thioester hydrolase|nr:acyl-CoA thioesterase [Dysgonamonadaceae bacterium]